MMIYGMSLQEIYLTTSQVILKFLPLKLPMMSNNFKEWKIMVPKQQRKGVICTCHLHLILDNMRH